MLKVNRKAHRIWIASAVCVVALIAVALPWTRAEADDGVNVRPIEDFLDAQDMSYTSETAPYNRSGIVDWISENEDGSWEWRARVDFLGVIDRDFIVPRWGESIGTTFSGKVTEKVQEDGRTLVHIKLRAKNALCVVGDQGLNVSRTVWGTLAGWAWFNNWGLDTLDTVDVKYDLRFLTADEPGSPLPRLTELLFNPREDQDVLQQLITMNGTGRLSARFGVEAGTSGKLTMTQKNVNNASFDPGPDAGINRDPWPVGRIDIRPVGE